MSLEPMNDSTAESTLNEVSVCDTLTTSQWTPTQTPIPPFIPLPDGSVGGQQLTEPLIEVSDVLEELNEENKRLLNELLFANNCLKVFIEFKTFIDLNSEIFKHNLEENQCKRYQELNEDLNKIKTKFQQNLEKYEKCPKTLIDCLNQEINETYKRNVSIGRKPKPPKRPLIGEDITKDEKSFTNSKTVKKHICVYPGCEFGTRDRYKLEDHINIHTGNRPYVCAVCDKSFAKRENLRTHLLIHKKSQSLSKQLTESKSKTKQTNKKKLKKIEKKRPKFISNLPQEVNKLIRDLDQLLEGSENDSNFNENDRNSDRNDDDFDRNDSDFDKNYTDFDESDSNDSERPKTSGVRQKAKTNHHQKREKLIGDQTNDQDFNCYWPGCEQQFRTNASLTAHMKNHSNDSKRVVDTEDMDDITEDPTDVSEYLLNGEYVCDFEDCNYRTKRRYRFIGHINGHKGLKPFKCSSCDKAFRSKQLMKRHFVLMHKFTDRILICHINDCNKQFNTEGLFQRHQREKHSKNKITNCRVRDQSEGTGEKNKRSYQSVDSYTDRPFKCTVDGCDKSFPNKTGITQHMIVHSTQREHQCTHEGCDKAFKDKYSLKYHFNKVHGNKNLVCDWPGCDYRTTDKNYLKIHVQQRHSSERNFPCDWDGCQQRFKRKCGLRKHMKTHLNDRQHVCYWPGCQYRAINSYNLKNHLAHHERAFHY